ncbi:MAG TPA: RNA polymerase sigma factor [Thermoanaerobaculia bacterium]
MATAAMHETLMEVDEARTTSVPAMDEETFRLFYERSSRSVWVYLARMTGDRQLADDLLQDTFYRFYRVGARHESDAHRRNSLFRIATNVARDACRRRKFRNHAPLPDIEREPIVPHDLAADVAGRTDLARAMEHLKPAQREMLWLAYALGASHQEIAVALDVKVGSVKLLLFRARKKLATFLRGNGRKA